VDGPSRACTASASVSVSDGIATNAIEPAGSATRFLVSPIVNSPNATVEFLFEFKFEFGRQAWP
jgi:hypothetical protein